MTGCVSVSCVRAFVVVWLRGRPSWRCLLSLAAIGLYLEAGLLLRVHDACVLLLRVHVERG